MILIALLLIGVQCFFVGYFREVFKNQREKMEYFEKTMQNLNHVDVPQLYRQFMCINEYVSLTGNKAQWKAIKNKRLNRLQFVGEGVKEEIKIQGAK